MPSRTMLGCKRCLHRPRKTAAATQMNSPMTKCARRISWSSKKTLRNSASVQTHDQKAVEAELEFLTKTIPEMEKNCELQGQCAKDFWIVEGLAKRMWNATEAGNWNQSEADYKDILDTLHKAHDDCHGSQDQCKEDAMKMEEDLKKMGESIKAQNA